jgi:hypothetical protein
VLQNQQFVLYLSALRVDVRKNEMKLRWERAAAEDDSMGQVQKIQVEVNNFAIFLSRVGTLSRKNSMSQN